MGRLVYTAITSLDGFIADEHGEFRWSAPDHEVHTYLNERDREVVTELYGRRLYEVMKVWQTFGTEPDASSAVVDYGRQWRSRDKIVYSRTLESVETARTTLERTFDPVAVRGRVDALDGVVSIGGAELAGHALRAGIVDAVEIYLNPVIIGAGTHWLPGGVGLDLRLTTQHRFAGGVVHLAYEVRR